MIYPLRAGKAIDATGGYGWAFLLAMISAALSLLLLLPISKTAYHAPP